MGYNKNDNTYTGYIYCITNNVNGKQYIGQTIRNVYARWKDHRTDYKKNRSNQVLYRAMNKYGIDNFIVCELESLVASTRDEATELMNTKEKEYILQLNTVAPNGYNMTIGGKLTDSQLRPVRQYDLECRFIAEYTSILEASNATGICDTGIQINCAGKKETAGWFIWRYAEDAPPTKIIPTKKNRIKQYSLQGELLKIWDSAEQVKEFYNKEYTDVYVLRCAFGRIMSFDDYVWRFYKDDFHKFVTPKFRPFRPNIGHRKRVVQKDLDGNKINTYESLITASEEVFGTAKKSNYISAVLIGKQKTAGGYLWEYDTPNII